MKGIAKSKNLIINSIMILITLFILIIPNYTNATVINPSDYEPNSIEVGDKNIIVNKSNPLIGSIKTVGIVVAVITIAVLGIKYMMAGINEKAEYKKTMIPYLIGAVLVVAITQLLSVLIEIVTNVK